MDLNLLYPFQLLVEEEKIDCSELPHLPLPIIEGNSIKVLFGATGDDDEPARQILTSGEDDVEDVRWAKLEEMLVAKAQGSAPMIFKPTITLRSNISNNVTVPRAIIDEPVLYSIHLENPLQIPLCLSQVRLLWTHEHEQVSLSNETGENSENSPVTCPTIDSVVLQPTSKERIILRIVPRKIGNVKVLGLAFALSSQSPADQATVQGKILFNVRGPKKKNVKEKPEEMYEDDYRLQLNVVEKAPLMEVSPVQKK